MSSMEGNSCTNPPLKEILEQASKWNLAGDLKLLQWMKNISLDMEQRAQRTTNALRALDSRVKNTSVTLNNTINSLVALQSGNQFVESCIQDDDDLVDQPRTTNVDEVISTPPSNDELYKKILDNNIEAIEECFEKVSVEIDDSGDEDDDDPGMISSVTYVYKPKSMYQGPPLPYIYGTQEWNDHWHVGLVEDTEYNHADNEMQDTYSTSSSSSSSSSTPTEDTASLASTSTLPNLPGSSQLSWKSSILKGSSSVEATEINRSLSRLQDVLTKTCGETGSTSTDSLVFVDNNFDNVVDEKSKRDQKRPAIQSRGSNTADILKDNVKEPMLDERISQEKEIVENPSNTSGCIFEVPPKAPPSAMQRNIVTAKEIPKTPSTFEDLFGEESESKRTSEAPNKSTTLEIKSKPVNLFDDNDFQSFMDELNSKTQKQQKQNRFFSKETEDKTYEKEPLKSLFNEDEDEEEEFLNIYRRSEKSTKKEKVSVKDEKLRVGSGNELHLPIHDRQITIQRPTGSQRSEKEEAPPMDAKITRLFVDGEKREEINKAKDKEKDPLEDKPLPELPKRYDLKSFLFLDDEPPDDDDFFESLKKSKEQRISSNKLFEDDVEQEQEEEEEDEKRSLPAKSTPFNRNSFSNLQRSLHPPSNTTYGGLQLINDIPPDDIDDQPDSIVRDTMNTVPNPQHIVSNIFYDDFNETIEAINQQPRTSPMSFCVFNEEPPPVEGDGVLPKLETPSAISCNNYNLPQMEAGKEDTLDGTMGTLKSLRKNNDREKSLTNTMQEVDTLWNCSAVQKDTPVAEFGIENEDKKGSAILTKDNDRNEQIEISDKYNNSNKVSGKVVGKLKTNLNINVNALLPMAYKTTTTTTTTTTPTKHEKPTVLSNNAPLEGYEERGGQEDSSYNTNISNEEKNSSWTEERNVQQPELPINDKKGNANYNYILPSLNKLRVRGPAQRRTPSRKSNVDKQDMSSAGATSTGCPSTENRSLNLSSTEAHAPIIGVVPKSDSTFRSSTPFECMFESQNVSQVIHTSPGSQQNKDLSSEMEISLPDAAVSTSTTGSSAAVRPSFSSLFDDEEDDFETLFGLKGDSKSALSLHRENLNTSLPIAVSAATFSSKSQLITVDSRQKDIPEKGKIEDQQNISVLAKKVTKMNEKLNLLGDSDEAQDRDILTEENKRELKKDKTKKPFKPLAGSLFDSGSEDEDDLFKRPSEPVDGGKSLQSGLKLSQKKFLFSDDDDDDDADERDLFGGVRRSTTSGIAQVSTVVKTDGRDEMPSRINGKDRESAPDNPLADLL